MRAEGCARVGAAPGPRRVPRTAELGLECAIGGIGGDDDARLNDARRKEASEELRRIAPELRQIAPQLRQNCAKLAQPRTFEGR